MIYCPYCGTKNSKDAKVCKKCGEKLYQGKETKPAVGRGFGPDVRRTRHEQECFGLPRLGAMMGIAIGLVVILFGAGIILSRYYRTQIEIWPLADVVFGLMVVAAAHSALRRK